MKPPVYFKDVRRKAGKIWSQLEQEEELAAPWKHLFRQVQSPRHVLSELLQNADDAGATMASATLEDGVFTFEHNGKDFSAEQFESLCRFGFSNKRSLHTIGFRGIGFKSTFSLGDTVEVYSPTLAVRFHRERFTEPEWIAGAEVGANTRIQIQITDRNRAQELRKNFKEWTESPSSLLFFTHLHDLRIQGRHMAKQTHGPGPVPHSERLSLSEAGWQNLIVMRSGLENFPPTCWRKSARSAMSRSCTCRPAGSRSCSACPGRSGCSSCCPPARRCRCLSRATRRLSRTQRVTRSKTLPPRRRTAGCSSARGNWPGKTSTPG